MSEIIASPKKTREIIEKYGFSFQKKFGQNFLIDLHVLNKIILGAEITKEDIVIEIGPGIGSLTQYLAEHAKKVIAIEIDQKLIPILQDTLVEYNNVKIINHDILKVDLNQLIREESNGETVKIIANLPYYITTPIIMGIFENNVPVDSITVMVQKEVAERIQATPGSKDYGALSLAVSYYATSEIIANVPPNCFMPRPKVGSAVIKMAIHNKQFKVKNEKLLFQIIKAGFNQRRKTLVNSLYNQGNLEMPKEEIQQVIIESGFNEKIRGEALSLENYIDLTNKMVECKQRYGTEE